MIEHNIDLNYFIRNAHNISLVITEWLNYIGESEELYTHEIGDVIQTYNDLKEIAEKLNLSVKTV